MAIPSELEYGATRPAAPSKASSKVMRLAAVSAAILVCMVGTVLLMAESPAEGEVEMEIITPQDKLNRLVMEFVKKGDKLSVGQMEAKLDQWRHNPDTLLDLPEQARTQVCQIQTLSAVLASRQFEGCKQANRDLAACFYPPLAVAGAHSSFWSSNHNPHSNLT